MNKYVLFRSPKTKEWYFHLLAKNGKKVGLEGYKRKAGALKAIRIFQASAGAQIVVSE